MRKGATTQQRVVGFLWRYDVAYLEMVSGVGALFTAALLVALCAGWGASYFYDLVGAVVHPLLGAALFAGGGTWQLVCMVRRRPLCRALTAMAGAATWCAAGTLVVIGGRGVIALSGFAVCALACVVVYVRMFALAEQERRR